MSVYLKPEVKIEPLICRWYAWSYLIAPAQLAMHITYRIIPLLESFVDSPAPHVTANSFPEMYGGHFVALSVEDVQAVKNLIEETKLQCSQLMQFAADLRALDAQLQTKASGFTLNEFYGQLPESLRGLVELLYDVQHRPKVRVLESLVYEDQRHQNTVPVQEIMLQAIGERERHFFMSTPRLAATDSVSLKLRFDDRRIDELAAMRSTASDLKTIASLLEVTEADMPLFSTFFRHQAPVLNGQPEYRDPGVRMRYFGHACVLFQTAEISVLFDPFVSLEETADGRLTLHDLPSKIDYVVLTHSHQDHFSPEILLQLRHRIGRVVVPANNSGNTADPSMKLMLNALGFDDVIVLDALDKVTLPSGAITSLPFTGEHADLDIYSKQAIALDLNGSKFMFLVDSDVRDPALYSRIMRTVGPVDVLFIGMECHGAPLNWLYEPVLAKQVSRKNNESRRLSGADCERAWQIQSIVQAPRVFVYAMGQEPWMQYIMGLQYQPDSVQLTESNKFLELCKANGFIAERLFNSREEIFLSN